MTVLKSIVKYQKGYHLKTMIIIIIIIEITTCVCCLISQPNMTVEPCYDLLYVNYHFSNQKIDLH